MNIAPAGPFKPAMRSPLKPVLRSPFFRASGGSAAVQPNRAVSAWNRMPSTFGTVSGTQLKMKIRIFFAVQGPLSEIRLNFSNWRTDPTGIVLCGNGWTIEELALEVDGGSFAPVRFSGGRTQAVGAGGSFLVSDAVTPAALGLGTSIPNGQGFWFRGLVGFSAAGHEYPRGIPYENAGGQAFPNSVGFVYDPAVNTTTGAIDGTGPISLGAGGISAVSNPIFPVIQGKFVSGSPTVWAIVGDSITQGLGDTLEGDKLGLSGFVQRGLINATFNGGWRAGINFGSSGTTAAMWSGPNNALAKAYWALCNGYIGNYGTNDLAGGGTLGALQTLMQGLWTDVRAAGITTLLQCHLMPRTNSTDSWATAGANQTGVNAAFNSGGAAQQYNTWLGTQISGSGITAQLALNTLRDGGFPEDWVVTGAANYATADGVHPSAAGHVLGGNELRTLVASYP